MNRYFAVALTAVALLVPAQARAQSASTLLDQGGDAGDDLRHSKRGGRVVQGN